MEANDKIDEAKNPRRECLVCKTAFLPKNYWQKYCSQECKLFAYTQKKINERIRKNEV